MKNRMARRRFLKTTTAVAATSIFYPFSKTRAANKSTKPDILMIMPDQMRGDCLSILGHSALTTPNLDKLTAKGVLFRRAYTTVASCIPARYALLTGLYPQTSGVVGFRAKKFSTATLPHLLTINDYSTILVGRNMHQPAASGACGYQKRIHGSTYVANDEYDKFLKKSAPDTGGIRKLVSDIGVTYNLWQAKAWPLENRLHPTEWIVARSRDMIRQANTEQPLFLTASFYAPHPPLFPPRKYFNAYLNKQLQSPARGDWVDFKSISPKGDKNGHRVLLEGQILQAAQAGYFGLIEHLDEQISSLITDFKNRSEKAGRPWIIVVTSDHGEMLGDHGYFRKCEPYEGSANIPFIICGSPSLGFKAGLRINQPVCLEDIMPTLLALAGTKSPDHVDGVNLGPALRGHKQLIRKWLHFEHAPCYSTEQAFHALTDGHYKYIWRPTDGAEHLFDLDKDLTEEHDLSNDSSHRAILQKWRECLIQRLADRPEGFSKDGRLIPGRPYRPLNKGTLTGTI
jgi:arylsulfatase A-like enzyme